MATTSDPFHIQPWAVLGVDRDANPSEIRSAFREKSKKHHPDLGGDEWAFRMVQRAYESLRGQPMAHLQPGVSAANAVIPEPASAPSASVSDAETPQTDTGNWLTQIWPNAVRWFHPLREGRSRARMDKKGSRPRGDAPAHQSEEEARSDTATFRDSIQWPLSPEALLSLRTVEVDLIWLRFISGLSGGSSGVGAGHGDISRETDATSTLSVSLVVSWPPVGAVNEVSRDPEAGKALRAVIDAFESLKHGAGPTDFRSGIEDGRFIGWLSYPDVLRAEGAFERFRDQITPSGLSIRLRTGQERIPRHWRQDAEAEHYRGFEKREARFG